MPLTDRELIHKNEHKSPVATTTGDSLCDSLIVVTIIIAKPQMTDNKGGYFCQNIDDIRYYKFDMKNAPPNIRFFV